MCRVAVWLFLNGYRNTGNEGQGCHVLLLAITYLVMSIFRNTIMGICMSKVGSLSRESLTLTSLLDRKEIYKNLHKYLCESYTYADDIQNDFVSIIFFHSLLFCCSWFIKIFILHLKLLFAYPFINEKYMFICFSLRNRDIYYLSSYYFL